MSRQRYIEQGLFDDALSGEFYPPSDPLQRAHSLSRLAIATAMKGEEEFSLNSPAYAYTPSWAPKSSSMAYLEDSLLTTLALEDHSGENPIQSRSFSLLSGLERKLEIADTEEIIEILDLDLGPLANENRAIIAEIAQNFFDAYQ